MFLPTTTTNAQPPQTPMKHLAELKELSPATLRMLFCNHAIAVKGCRDANGLPLWSIVGKLCSVGSTSAAELCRLADLEPWQIVTKTLTGWDSFASVNP